MANALLLAARMPSLVSKRSSTSLGMPLALKKTTGMCMSTSDGPPSGGSTSRGTALRLTTLAGHQSCPSTLAHTTLPGPIFAGRPSTAPPTPPAAASSSSMGAEPKPLPTSPIRASAASSTSPTAGPSSFMSASCAELSPPAAAIILSISLSGTSCAAAHD